MKKIAKFFPVAILISLLSLSALKSKAHCEIPCGIYEDSVRISLLYENIETIEKSMNMINELSISESPDYNQLVRWVINKEDHAIKIQDIISQYFLHQRIKPTTNEDSSAYEKYLSQLESLHRILVSAMKSKQSTDVSIIETLREEVQNFEHLYFEHEH